MEISPQRLQPSVEFRAVPQFSNPAVKATESHICNEQNTKCELSALGGAMVVPLKELFDRLFSEEVDGPELVDQTFQQVLHGNRADAFDAMANFQEQIQDFSRNELIDTQQYIVKKMARQRNPESFQILMKMHALVSEELKDAPWFKPEYFLA